MGGPTLVHKHVRLGAFDLAKPIGRGGTGVVWHGTHVDTGVPVAVKVLDRAGPADPAVPDPFRTEVRAMAALDHPGVVKLYDVGRVTAEAARARPGDLDEGSPYVAMEYASGGTLASFVPSSWDADVLPLLLGLLDALGHAHARQLIHRDLKPGNVLRAGPGDLRPGWKLTDFGIATALERTVERSMAQELVGTLAYMSPEQIHGEWREFGPWTDLYALGCMMYRLVGSQRPFGVVKGPALIAAHLIDKPERLVARIPVPPDLDAWVAKLVEKRAADRFQSAAEAARTLVELGSPVVPHDLLPQPLRAPTTAEILEGPTEGPTEVVRGGSSRGGGRIPDDWRSKDPPALPPREVSAGLALIGLRTPPIVGRVAERDLLWDRMRTVLARGRAEVVVIHGAPGVGKTALARWIGEIAHARGGLPFLVGEARHGEAPAEALARPFRRALRTVRLGYDQRVERVARVLGKERAALCADVAAMLEPSGTGSGTNGTGNGHGHGNGHGAAEGHDAQSLGAEARYAAARQLVEHIALRARGAVLVFDDAHLSADLFRFAIHVARAQPIRPTPALVVLVATDPCPAVEPDLVELATIDRVSTIELGPLSLEDHERLIRAVLPLESTLAAQLAERTTGNPMHAVQVIRGWVGSRRLARVDGGFVLDPPDDAVIAPLPEVWREHLKRVFAGLPPVARSLLERAAALGSSVDEDEWQRVCDDPKAEWAARGQVRFLPENGLLRAELRERLLAEQLAEDAESGWRFVHELFRETLLTLAGSAGRLGGHHRACARTLLYRADSRRLAERIGRHLLAGERPDQSLPHLVEAFRQRLRTSGDRAALPLLGEIQAALGLAGVEDEDIRWAELAVRQAEVFARLGRMQDARRAAVEAERRGKAGEWRLLRARAAQVLGQVRMHAGDLPGADVALARAEGFVREGEDPRLLGAIHATRSQCAEGIGDTARARGHAVLAAKFLSEAGQRVGLAEAWAVLGQRSQRDGDLAEAEASFERARALQARVGTPIGEAHALRALGEVAIARGDLEQARSWLSRAADRYRSAGSPDVVLATLGLARVELARRDWLEAHRHGSMALADAESRAQVAVELGIHAVLAASTAAMRDWPPFDVHLLRIAAIVERHEARVLRDPETVRSLELCQARIVAAGQTERAATIGSLVARLTAGEPPAR